MISREKQPDCQSCKIISTGLMTGIAGYLLYTARRHPTHRLFLNLAGGAMSLFAAANWILRSLPPPTSNTAGLEKSE